MKERLLKIKQTKTYLVSDDDVKWLIKKVVHHAPTCASTSASGRQRKMGSPKVDSVTKVSHRSASKGVHVASGASL
jgi:hypothetical protein